jgi:EAL domain-containing protein (putative c-di-GMP-specific phosphodiesterase class I)
LSYLHRFPCDTIKVDRSLVRDSGLNGSTPLILKSIIALAHELGKEVVAEGVETERDAAYLRSIGCEFGQGYYYGEPMSSKDVANLLSALASHRKKKSRERSRAPEDELVPASSPETLTPEPLPALPGPDPAPSTT